MESIEGHLSGRLSDRLGCSAANTLAWLDHIVKIFKPIYFFKLSIFFQTIHEIKTFLRHRAQICTRLVLLHHSLITSLRICPSLFSKFLDLLSF